MGVYDIQFTLEDVVAKVLKDKDKLAEMLDDHSLRSPNAGLSLSIQLIDRALRLAEKDFNIKDHEASEKVKILQQDREVIEETYLLFNDTSLPTRTDEEIRAQIRKYYESISALARSVPCFGILISDSFFTGLSERECNAEKVELTRQFFRKYEKNIDAEARIIIYTANRIFSPNFTRERYHLGEDVRGIYREYKDICADAGIVLYVYFHDEIETDKDLSMLVVEQLLRNAIQHAFKPVEDVKRYSEEKEISIVSEVKKDTETADKGMYLVRVSDNGYGIKLEHVQQMFEQGFSTKEEESEVKGNGLYIARELLRSLGGDLTFTTELGKGTTFVMSLPFEGKNYVNYKQRVIHKEKC